VGNAVLRGDLRARGASRKVLAIEFFYLGILGLLTLLGLPPELNRPEVSNQTSLGLALLGVQGVLVTYFASACAAQEIAVEGERPSVDLAFGPFPRRMIVVGKSLASLATIVYWLLLGSPLLILAIGIRQGSMVMLAAVSALVAIEAWGIAQLGLLYSIVIDSEFSRAVVHWTTLLALFVATLALPVDQQWLNPIVAVARAAGGAFPVQAVIVYAALGLAAGGLAQLALRRYGAS